MPEFLIVKPSSLGDIIHGLQVVQTLKEQISEMKVSWIVRDTFAPLVEACDTVDHIYPFYRKGGCSGFYRLIQKIRKKKFDKVLDMQGLARSGLMTFFAKAERKIGRSDAREGARICYPEITSLPPSGPGAHAIEILLQFCKKFDLAPELKGRLQFKPTPSDNIPEGLLEKKPILLFPNSRRPEKEWPHFGSLTSRLFTEIPDCTVAWVGNDPIPQPQEGSSHGFYNLLGRTSLTDLPTLIEAASIVISNDSGPMHLAAAMDTPVLALFGPTAPEMYGPYPLDKPSHCVVQAPQGDLKQLKVETVLNALRPMLKD